jgi:hypothetical protein
MFQAPIARCVYCLEWVVEVRAETVKYTLSFNPGSSSLSGTKATKVLIGKHMSRPGSLFKWGSCHLDNSTVEVSAYANVDAYDYENMWLPLNSYVLTELEKWKTQS